MARTSQAELTRAKPRLGKLATDGLVLQKGQNTVGKRRDIALGSRVKGVAPDLQEFRQGVGDHRDAEGHGFAHGNRPTLFVRGERE